MSIPARTMKSSSDALSDESPEPSSESPSSEPSSSDDPSSDPVEVPPNGSSPLGPLYEPNVSAAFVGLVGVKASL